MTPGYRYLLGAVAAVARARIELMAGVRDDPTGYARISEYYRDGLGWERDYVPTSDSWCGAFVAWCWRPADDRPGLLPDLRRYLMSSAYRIDRGARYRSEHWPDGPSRQDHEAGNGGIGLPRRWQRVDDGGRLDWDPAPGDIVLVGPPDWRGGSGHVGLVVGYDLASGEIETIEGNIRPPGEDVDQVGRRVWLPGVYDGGRGVCRVIRWSPADVVPGG